MNQHLLKCPILLVKFRILFSLSSNYYNTLLLHQDTPVNNLLSQTVIQLNELDDGSFKSISQMRSTLYWLSSYGSCLPAVYTDAVVMVFLKGVIVAAFSASSSATVFCFAGAPWGMLFGGGAGKITLPSWQEIFTVMPNMADGYCLEKSFLLNPAIQASANIL